MPKPENRPKNFARAARERMSGMSAKGCEFLPTPWFLIQHFACSGKSMPNKSIDRPAGGSPQARLQAFPAYGWMEPSATNHLDELVIRHTPTIKKPHVVISHVITYPLAIGLRIFKYSAIEFRRHTALYICKPYLVFMELPLHEATAATCEVGPTLKWP